MIEEKRIINEKKKQEFNFLRDQMETDLKVGLLKLCLFLIISYRLCFKLISIISFQLKRREDEKTQQKQEDKEYMQKLMNRDFELNENKRELEKQIK